MRKSVLGFTLTELMIVVGLISFLAVLITAFLRPQVFKANDAKRKADIKRISIAIEEYEKDNDCYPPASVVSCENNGIGLIPYLNSIPCDPVSKDSYGYENDGSNCSKWYILYGDLQNEIDSDYLPNIGPQSLYSYYYSSPNAPTVTSGATQNGADIFYGCFSGSCLPISGTICQPNYGSSSCYGNCVNPQNECI